MRFGACALAVYICPENPVCQEFPTSLSLPHPLLCSLSSSACCHYILPVPQLILSFSSVVRSRCRTVSLQLHLAPLGSSALVLCCSGSTAASQIPPCASVASAICSTLAFQFLPVALALQFSISTLGSSPIHSTVGRLPGYGLGPTWFLLLLASPSIYSSLAPSFIGSFLSPPYVCSSI